MGEQGAARRPAPSAEGALVFAVVVCAAAWAGYSAWDEQRYRTLPLDLDGWGHLVSRLQENGGSFASLFTEPSLWKGPVVPFLFGLCYWAAPFDTSVLVLNAGLFAVAAGLLFIAFRRLGAGRWAAFAAVLLWVFYLPHRTVFGYYYAEPAIALLSAGLFWLAGQMATRPTPWAAFALGVTGGALILARAPFLLVVAGLPLVLWRNLGDRRLPLLALYGAGLVLTFSPWPIRNYLAEGEVIPFTTEGGKILFQGTYLPGDDVGMGQLRQLSAYREIEAGEEGKSHVQQYRFWQALAFAQIRADPVAQFGLCARKAVRFWIYLPAHSWVPAWKTAVVAALALPLAAVGAWRGRRRPLTQLCLLWVCALWLFHALVHSELRYNFPVLPMLFLLALVGLGRGHGRREPGTLGQHTGLA
jgi:hypothetical protein